MQTLSLCLQLTQGPAGFSMMHRTFLARHKLQALETRFLIVFVDCIFLILLNRQIQAADSKVWGRNIGMMMLDQSCQLAILGLKSKTSAAPWPRDPMAFADALPHRMVINPRKDLVDARIERCELSGLRVDTPEPRSYWKHNWLS